MLRRRRQVEVHNVKIFLTTRERVAGLFLLTSAALVVAFFVGAAVRNRWLAPRVRFHTLVERGEGLRSGSPILLSGVEVGEIGEVAIREDARIDIELVVLAQHAPRLQVGTKATVRRLLGIGEKRIHLTSAGSKGAALAPGSLVPALEPMDVLDVVSEVDLGAYLRTRNRAVGVMEVMLQKLEEDKRFERMVEALDRLGPTMDRLDKLLAQTHDPLVKLLTNPAIPGAIAGAEALLQDPALHGAIAGANSVFHDPSLRRAYRNAGDAFEPHRFGRFLGKAEATMAGIDALTATQGPLVGLMGSVVKLLADQRLDRLIGAIERLTDEKKLGRILDNVAVLAEQTAKIGPEIPKMVRELSVTLREAVVVLKALQRTWMLESKAQDVRKEMPPPEKTDADK